MKRTSSHANTSRPIGRNAGTSIVSRSWAVDVDLDGRHTATFFAHYIYFRNLQIPDISGLDGHLTTRQFIPKTGHARRM